MGYTISIQVNETLKRKEKKNGNLHRTSPDAHGYPAPVGCSGSRREEVRSSGNGSLRSNLYRGRLPRGLASGPGSGDG